MVSNFSGIIYNPLDATVLFQYTREASAGKKKSRAVCHLHKRPNPVGWIAWSDASFIRQSAPYSENPVQPN